MYGAWQPQDIIIVEAYNVSKIDFPIFSILYLNFKNIPNIHTFVAFPIDCVQ